MLFKEGCFRRVLKGCGFKSIGREDLGVRLLPFGVLLFITDSPKGLFGLLGRGLGFMEGLNLGLVTGPLFRILG